MAVFPCAGIHFDLTTTDFHGGVGDGHAVAGAGFLAGALAVGPGCGIEETGKQIIRDLELDASTWKAG